MKLVINTERHGFGLSKTAVMYYADLKGITLWPVQTDFRGLRYYILPPEERMQPIGMRAYLDMSESERAEYDNLQDTQVLKVSDIQRNDPALAQTIEDLGEVANTRHVKLKVVEVPDDVDWEIKKVDGGEIVIEKHREWS